MTKFDLLICDWAGTTVDFGSFAPIEALDLAFKENGVEATDAEIREPMGMTKIDHIRTMFNMPRIEQVWQECHGRQATDDDVEKVYQTFNASILKTLDSDKFAQPKPGVLDTIAALEAAGMQIGSTTGYTSEMMAALTPHTTKLGYQPATYKTADDVDGYGRPYPYMIFAVMKELEVDDVRRVIKVGDTISDIKEGLNAGVYSTAVLEGSSEMGLRQEEYEALSKDAQDQLKADLKAKFEAAGADQVFDNFSELKDFLLG
ncbi:phosphonoacetaldehyde hydrolase [Aerococcus urinaehominis]|uniref:Phosphonoacetaldehyde hydrolase n=1 Tax=Aerococcus urinaehominis TaxID=128944 RepID=A0A0X8FJG7_9LACT|nr:phosphonoacetaldehyde hydrolase [Aerococcus urinaehominis]AMB98480.1 phosphonoacetaldehyde hydrolase [Aerococcus urinaehominis]SDL81454.1 phosphonoacetaldehyde hydrolase [Aerococcus urinaehominis]